MSEDLIKKEEAKEAVCKGCLKDWGTCHHHWDCPMLTNLEMLPSADRPQGEWVEHKGRTIVRDNNFIDFFPTEYECSNCGLRRATYFINSPLSNYCPNCGAKMDGERKESEDE